MKFIGREYELNSLNEWWREKKAHLIVVYGKRRIGKTELIKQFIKDKPAVYFLADKVNDKENLKAFSKSIGSFFEDAYIADNGFNDWYHLFEYIRSKKARMVLAIDEFPYLAESNAAISSVFQKGWDEYLKDTTQIILILSGSSIGMMESHALAHKAPLYGRRSGQILLQPLRFNEFRKFFPNKKFDEFLKIHTVTGGVPAYIVNFAQKGRFIDVLEKQIFNKDAFLHNEVEFILKEELREPRTYFSILKAIALGKRKFGEIINETGLQKNIIMKYLHVLEDLYVIRKEIPVTEKVSLRSKRGFYCIRDQFFIFWFNYVLPFKSDLELGKYDNAFLEMKKSFGMLTALNYEKIAQEILIDNSHKIFPFSRAGRWWDTNDEIDIVAVNEKENKILFGEAKWSNKKVGIDIYEQLKRKSQSVIWGKRDRDEYFCLFGKSGFTDEMIRLAKEENVFLFFKEKLTVLS